MKLLRIFFYPFYNTCQTVQNINIFQSVCFLPKSHIQPVLGYTYTKVAGFMGQLFVWLALLFLVLYSMSSDCSVKLSLSLFLRLWFQRFLLTYEGGLFYVFTNYTTFKLQRVGRLKFNRFLTV